VGVVFYQMLYGRYPYFGMSDMEILKKIETTRPDFKGVNLSDDARDFIEKCMTDNRTKRITWREIYNHPLIKQEEKMIYGLTSRLDVKKNE
jgi:serine/threonine protein kinase